MDRVLITELQQPALYDHPVTCFEVIETHISWVLLTGTYAYKFRKPVNFGFLDFSSLEQRRADCREELRLNRRQAADLYLDLTRITRTDQGLAIDGDGEIVEYAVKMRQFEGSQLLSALESAGELTPALIEQLGSGLADFHQRLPRAPVESDWGTVQTLTGVVNDNFVQIAAHLDGGDPVAALDRIRAWSRDQLQRHRKLIESRRHAGRVRECHGDLHLGNIVRWQGQPLPFDCIEFNPRYRWIDTLNDLAFLLMDLDLRGQCPLAHQLLNRYLELTGDYVGVPLLPLFKSYRAMVRAKVALLGDDAERVNIAQRYIDLADAYRATQEPSLTLMHGVSGSGKSWHSARLLAERGMIRIRSDRERMRLFTEPGERYSSAASNTTYAALLQLAENLLDAGVGVIVDATFLRHAQRAPFIAAARKRRLRVEIQVCEATPRQLQRRIDQRRQIQTDPSEADVEVMQQQRRQLEPLSPAERQLAVMAGA